jgi:signal transduction histidine kinase
MNRLWMRLAVSFLIATLLVIAVIALVVRKSVESSFGHYVSVSNMARFGGDLVTELERYYYENGGWSGVGTLLPQRGGGSGAGGENSRGAQVYVADMDGVIVAATQQEWVAMPFSDIGPSRHVDLVVNGQVVGILGEQTPGTVALNDAEHNFLQEITNGLLLTALVAGLVTFVLGIGLSYSLTRPLEALTRHITDWRLKEETTPLEIRGTEEIRRLGTAFNGLLARLVQGEALRQRMSADVAHELRTPVTVMRGHLEAMMDGVYPLDTAHLAVAYDQVLHLARLVEDLRLLTQAQAGQLPLNLSVFDLIPMIRSADERFEPLMRDKNIRMTMQLPSKPATVYADPHRVQQVVDNLLSNAARHSPTGGEIQVQIAQAGDRVTVVIANQSETPLTDDQVQNLFNRFWRGEDARARDTGGSGLGLAITRELLRLLGGSIHAERDGDLLRLSFMLPNRPITGGADTGRRAPSGRGTSDRVENDA